MWAPLGRRRLLDLVFLEEASRDIVDAIHSISEIGLPEEAKMRTKTIDRTPGLVNGRYYVLILSKEGVLEEALLVSDKPDYIVYIETDTLNITRSFTELSQISDYIESITAMQSNDSYIFHVSNIKFSWLRFYVVASSVNFSRVYAKWHEVG